MNFERGKEVKEAIKLGVKANAPRILNLYILDDEPVDFNTGLVRKTPNIVDPKVAMEYLIKIAEGQMDLQDFCFEMETPDGIGSLEPLWKYRGKYLKFRAGGYQAVSAYDYNNEFTNREILILIPPKNGIQSNSM